MFIWNVEEMKLMKDHLGATKNYCCESKTSREDKIAFIDSMQDGKLSYILDLAEKFKVDSETMSKDKWGNVKTTSLKAWIKKNDTKYSRNIIDMDYKYGQIYLLGVERHIGNINSKRAYDFYDDLVDEVFLRQLRQCENEEKNYFQTHDEYSVLKTTLKECMSKYGTTFGVHISYSSNGEMWIVNGENERYIEIEELKELIEKYKLLEDFISKITSETNIK